MLTYETAGAMVFIGASVAKWAVSLFKRLTQRAIGVGAKFVFLFKKVCESEIIGWIWLVRTANVLKSLRRCHYTTVHRGNRDERER